MNIATRPPRWFWVVAILSLLWSLAGCGAYLSQVSMDEAALARLPRAQADIWRAMPAWVTAAYAVAVWAALAASLLLLLRKRVAQPLFALSLVAVLVQFGWTFLANPVLSAVGPSAIGLPLAIIAVAAFMVWLSGRARQQRWIT